MVRVLFFIFGLYEGGAEKVLRNLVNGMDLSLFEITVQTLDNCEPRDYLKEGIRYRAINRCRTGLGKRLFSAWFRLCAEAGLAYPLFIKDDYDIEVAYLETGATKLIAQSTNTKALKIAWVHCDLSRKEGIAAAVGRIRRQYRAYDRIVCVSEDVRQSFCELFGTSFPTTVLRNVINDEEILRQAGQPLDDAAEDGVKRLLAVGRLAPEKGFARLIEACRRLRDANLRFQLDILGEGPERGKLEEQIAALQLKGIIRLRGFTENPYAWMKAADLIVCSSQYEGSSTVVQEALLLGKAVMTTPCAGMRELLGDSEYGLVTDESADGLYNGLRRLLEEPGELERYSCAARKRSAEFSRQRTVQETEAFLLHELRKKQAALQGGKQDE